MVFGLESRSPSVFQFFVKFVDDSPRMDHAVAFLLVGLHDAVKIESFAYQFVGDLITVVVLYHITF